MGKKSARERVAKAEAVKAAAASKKADRAARKQHRKSEARKRARQTQDEDAQFEAALEELGVRVVGVAGDGNCMFRSIADQIEGNANSHRRYRAAVVDFIRSHREEFEPFMEDDEKFDDYVARMDTDAEWGGHQELFAAAQALKVNFVIHQWQGPRMELYTQTADPSVETPPTLHLSYHGEMHYNSVRSMDDPATSGRAATPITLRGVTGTGTGTGGSGGGGGGSGRDAEAEAAAALVRVSVPTASGDTIRRTLRDTDGDAQAAIELLISGYEPPSDEAYGGDDGGDGGLGGGGGGSDAKDASAKVTRCDRCDKTDHATEDCPYFTKPREAQPFSSSARPPPPPPAGAGGAARGASKSSATQKSKTKTAETETKTKTTRSGECPCGSGKKYKKCCMKADRRRKEQQQQQQQQKCSADDGGSPLSTTQRASSSSSSGDPSAIVI